METKEYVKNIKNQVIQEEKNLVKYENDIYLNVSNYINDDLSHATTKYAEMKDLLDEKKKTFLEIIDQSFVIFNDSLTNQLNAALKRKIF